MFSSDHNWQVILLRLKRPKEPFFFLSWGVNRTILILDLKDWRAKATLPHKDSNAAWKTSHMTFILGFLLLLFIALLVELSKILKNFEFKNSDWKIFVYKLSSDIEWPNCNMLNMLHVMLKSNMINFYCN